MGMEDLAEIFNERFDKSGKKGFLGGQRQVVWVLRALFEKQR